VAVTGLGAVDQRRGTPHDPAQPLSQSSDNELSSLLVGAQQVVVVPLFAGGRVQAVVVAERDAIRGPASNVGWPA
jgi:hypothetical protein